MRAFRVAYDGRPFHGFQRQPDVPTVEGRVFEALAELGVAEGKPGGYAAAGRTDAGTSAIAQTVAFECPDWLDPAVLNAELPASIRAWASADVSAGFHATHDAEYREYVYHCYAPDADGERAETALDGLRGEHDFRNLTPDDANTVRDLRAAVRRDGEYLVFTFRAGGFARELVRRVVSLVHAVATGDADPSRVERVLGPAPVDGPEGVAPAPASPLVLADVGYPGVGFSVDDDAAASARGAFDRRRVGARTRARVATSILDGIGGSEASEGE